MEYTNSLLIDCELRSPYNSGRRTRSIDRITPHCVVGQLSAEEIGNCFLQAVEASCNYGIGKDGRVCLVVDEANRSWCSSNEENDQREITIECASDTVEPYEMNGEVYEKLIKLCVDICYRNGKKKLIWFSDQNKALSYTPTSEEMILTVHRWFANKACPGEWLYKKLDDVASRVTEQLGSNLNDGTHKRVYRIQCGIYSKKENAEKQLEKIKAAGFNAFIRQVDDMYKIQVGAYSVKENAEKQLEKIKSAGFDAFIIESNK